MIECKRRLETIETLELQIDKVSFKNKLKKFEELDTYARTTIKNEINNHSQVISDLESKINTTTSSLNAVSARFTPVEAKVPNFDSRLSKLEEIIRSHDFPNSLKTLVDQNLKNLLDDCKKRVENIEKLDVKIDQASLKEKMKKLDDLDTYTRT